MSPGSGPRRKTGSVRPAGGPADRNADPKAFAASVGEAVRRARQTRGWTQAELAERAGFSPNYVARLERGELGASFFVAHRLCKTLQIDISDLLHASGARTGVRRAARSP
jgi:ribosome-binding protein aMBF1 (putative translation factor)